MENNFFCFTCGLKPIEFTILSCDHLICSTCLQNRLKKSNDIVTVQCRCGRKTLSTEDSMLLSLKTPEMAEVKRQLEKIKSLENQNTEISNFLIHQSEISSKENTLLFRNKQNIDSQNQNQKYTFNPCENQYSKFFLKTEPLNLDESNPFFVESGDYNVKNKKAVKGVKSVQSIKSSQKVSEKASPKKTIHKSTPKRVASSIYSSNGRFSSDSLNSIAKQLQKQLKFLQIQYQKQIQTCQKAFKKIIKSIDLSYEKVISSLQKFYLEQASEAEGKMKDQLILGLPKIVKKKYESIVGKRVMLLNQKLLEYIQGNSQKKESQRQITKERQTRETVFFSKAINEKEVSLTEMMKSSSGKPKSKSKIKQCALYLAISPKSKNDRVVNYIDVIRKDTTSTKLSKKANLSKKAINGERIRIY